MQKFKGADHEYKSSGGSRRTAVPGLLLCLMTLIVLILDVSSGAMAEKQYVIYPAIFRIVVIVSALLAIPVIVRRIMDQGAKLSAEGYLFAGFGICMLISTAVNGLTREALMGVAVRYLGVPDFIVCMLVFFGCTALSSRASKQVILDAFVIIADLISVFALADHFFIRIEAFRNKNDLSAVFFHGNHYGYFLVMAILISAGFIVFCDSRRRVCGILSMTVNLAVLAFNQSLGAIIAVGTAMVVMLVAALITRSKYSGGLAAITGSLVLAGIIGLALSSGMRADVRQFLFDLTTLTSGGNHGYAGHLRWLLWTETSKLISERPVIGYGCEGIRTYLYDATGVASPHNEILTYAAFFGIPAALLYTAGVITVLFKAIRGGMGARAEDQDRTSEMTAVMATLGYFVSSLFGVGMFNVLPFFFIMMGIAADSGCSGTKGQTIEKTRK